MEVINKSKTFFSISKAVAWQLEQTNKYVYIMDLSNQQQYKFNDIAGDIWKMISNKKSMLEIYKEISLIYDAEIKQIQEDVDCFVNQLLELNLIKTYK